VAIRRLWRVLVAGIPLGGVSVLFFARRSIRLILCTALFACADSRTPAAIARDDFGDPVRIGAPPQRIVSLNPATTEMVFALGAGSRLVGRSRYDAFPDSAKLVPSLGNGMRPNIEAVLGVHPDLVILYASQDDKPAADRLRAAGVNTLSLKNDSIGDFRRTVKLLGAVIGDTARARIVTDTVYRTLERVRSATARLPRPTVFWHIWDAPVITIGSGSFMNELVEIAGAKNIYADIKGPSGEISLEDIARRNPDFILAGPVGKGQIESEARWKIVPAARGRILVVDTALVGRPSVRLGEAAVMLANLLHPGTVR
jgi:iron complex transport system substrate-binding protein